MKKLRRRITEYRLLRVGQGIPLFEVSLSTGIEPSLLGRIERGLVEPTDEEREKILAALGPDAKLVLPAVTKILKWLSGDWPGVDDGDDPGAGRAA